MIIEVTPKDNCADCVFCEEMSWCRLMDGEHIDYDYENGREVATFCPLVNPELITRVTNMVKIIKE